MFKYIPDLFNSAKKCIDGCSSKMDSISTNLDTIISSSKFVGFSRNDLIEDMQVYLKKAQEKMEQLETIEANVRKLLNIEDPSLAADGMKGFSTSEIPSRKFNVDDLLAIVNEINSANNSYGVGQTRKDRLIKKFGAKIAELVQSTIDNGCIVSQKTIDYLESEENNNVVYTGYVDANFGNIEIDLVTSGLVELATAVLKTGNAFSAYKEIAEKYGSDTSEMVQYIINNNLKNGNIEINDNLYFQLINSGYLDKFINNGTNVENSNSEDNKSIDESIIKHNSPGEKKEDSTDRGIVFGSLSKLLINTEDEKTPVRVLEVYNKMRSFGYTDTGAKALLANLLSENNTLDPTVVNSTGAIGICQWLDSTRQNNLRDYCERNNLNPYSLDGQLEFMNYELQNNYNNMANGEVWGKLYDQVTGQTDRGYTDIAQNITIYYEAPSNDSSKNNAIGVARANSEIAQAAIELIDNNCNTSNETINI